MIVFIRGINGAGKSTVVRQFMERNGPVREVEKNVGMFTKQKPRAIRYWLPHRTVALGNYEYHRMGGLDGFTPVQTVWDLIEDTNNRDDVDFTIAESVILSQNKGRVVGLGEKYGPEEVLVLTLDTPLELCFERIYQRQEEAGKERKINTGAIEYAHGRIWKMHDFFREEDVATTKWLDHERPAEALEQILREQGWQG